MVLPLASLQRNGALWYNGPNWGPIDARFGVDCHAAQRESLRSGGTSPRQPPLIHILYEEPTMTTGKDEFDCVAAKARDLMERGYH